MKAGAIRATSSRSLGRMRSAIFCGSFPRNLSLSNPQRKPENVQRIDVPFEYGAVHQCSVRWLLRLPAKYGIGGGKPSDLLDPPLEFLLRNICEGLPVGRLIL
jgi:hypothetical protein